jgi:Trypsin-like peptidase domain/Effector-associated domain 1
MMPGVDFGEFQDGILEGFDKVELEQLLRVRLNTRLDNVVGAGAFGKVVFELLNWAERRGLEADLARAAYLERPNNDKLRNVYEKYGMAPPVSVQSSGTPVAGAPARATAPAFEATVKPRLKSVDLGVWRERLARIEGQVCRIEFNNNAQGTGFLVGPDVLLTNYHVLERPLKGQLPVEQVACRFDYKVLSDDSRSEGVVVRLHKEGWRIDESRYSQAEADAQPDRELPKPDELDFAAVRLARPIGNEPIDKNGAGGAPKRGWIAFPPVQPALDPGAPLFIAEHPDGSPMKLALDTDSVLGVNGNGTRVRYATNTEHGSSGSPCFDMDFALAALHHMGDPLWKTAKYNQGIPIALIGARLAGKLEPAQ